MKWATGWNAQLRIELAGSALLSVLSLGVGNIGYAAESYQIPANKTEYHLEYSDDDRICNPALLLENALIKQYLARFTPFTCDHHCSGTIIYNDEFYKLSKKFGFVRPKFLKSELTIGRLFKLKLGDSEQSRFAVVTGFQMPSDGFNKIFIFKADYVPKSPLKDVDLSWIDNQAGNLGSENKKFSFNDAQGYLLTRWPGFSDRFNKYLNEGAGSFYNVPTITVPYYIIPTERNGVTYLFWTGVSHIENNYPIRNTVDVFQAIEHGGKDICYLSTDGHQE